jgi:hypothetical protein
MSAEALCSFHPDLVDTKNDNGKEPSFLATPIAHRKFVERGGGGTCRVFSRTEELSFPLGETFRLNFVWKEELRM